MAMLDDPEWLLKHIRHSFITSDDTGMCEMVLQDNDLYTLDQHRQKIRQLKETKRAENARKKQKQGLPESFGRSTPVGSPSRSHSDTSSISSNPVIELDTSDDLPPLSPSPDIRSEGWDFGARRRSNTAQKLERIRKERQSRVKVNTMPWRKKNSEITEEQLSSMFEKKNLVKIEHAGKRTTNNIPSRTHGSLANSSSKTDPSKQGVISSTTVLNNGLNSDVENIKHLGFEVEDTYTEILPILHNGNENIAITIDIPDAPLPSHLTNHQTQSISFEKKMSNHSSPEHNIQSEKSFVRRKRGMSALASMLMQSTEQYNNPFREYSKFDAHGQGGAAIKKVDIFVWPFSAEKPQFSMMISVLAQKAKVQDVVGLTCWKYIVENQEPLLTGTTVQRYSLHIAEDDGTVDTDFPPLEPTEPFSKFSFATLALVEKRVPLRNENGEDESIVKETVFVKVNDFGGSSLVRVDDLNITMGEILKKTLKKRKGQSYTGKYRLEYQDKVGVVVKEDQTLESTGTMEFYLVREHSSRNNDSFNAFDGNLKTLSGKLSPNDEDYRFPPNPRTPTHSIPDNSFIFVPTMEYVTFRFYQLHKLRSPTPVDFGVGPNQVDVEPVDRRETRSAFAQLLSPRTKTLSIRVSMLAYCAIYDTKNRSNSLSVSPSSSSGSFSSSMSSFAHQDSISSKSTEKSVFKLYYRLSENHTDFKHLTLEGLGDEVQEALERVRNVMMLNGDKTLQAKFEIFKFGIPQSTSSSSNSTVTRRRGSIFR